MSEPKKGKASRAYGGKKHGKYSYGALGFGGNITMDYTRVKQEDWDRIFGKKEDINNG